MSVYAVTQAYAAWLLHLGVLSASVLASKLFLWRCNSFSTSFLSPTGLTLKTAQKSLRLLLVKESFSVSFSVSFSARFWAKVSARFSLKTYFQAKT